RAGKRPPHQSHALQAAAGDGRRSAGRDHRRAGERASGGIAGGGGGTIVTGRTLAGGSIGATRRRLALGFRRGGRHRPAPAARTFVGHALGLDHTALAAQSSRMLAADEAGAIAALSARRLAREPVARLLGRKEFWGLPLKVNAETLLPRPATETVVQAALPAVDPGDR